MIITIDFETYYSTDYSLSKIPIFEYVKDERFKAHGVSVKIDDEPSFWVTHKDIQKFFDGTDWKGATVIAHNSNFDFLIAKEIYNWDWESCGQLVDTMGMANALVKPLNKYTSLKTVSSFLGVGRKLEGELEKTMGIRDLPHEVEEGLVPYALNDTDITYASYLKMREEMPDKEMDVLDLHLRLTLRRELVINPVELSRIAQMDLEQRDELFRQAKNTWPEIFGGCSNADEFYTLIRKDNKSIIFDVVKAEGKICPKKRNKAGKVVPDVSKTSLDFKRLSVLSPNLELCKAITERAGSSLMQSRIGRFLKMEEMYGGRLVVPIGYHNAHTGRSGGLMSINMQNLPKELRPAIKAPEGRSLVIADSSNIEARVLAWFSGQEDILDICRGADVIDTAGGSAKEEGKDIYTAMAKKIGSSDRALGKMVVLGCGFGMSLDTFIFNAKINGTKYDDETLSRAFLGWRRANPKTVEFWNVLANDFREAAIYKRCVVRDKYAYEPYKHGTALILPSGRRMLYPSVTVEKGRLLGQFGQRYWYGLLVENLVQATARDVVFYQALESDWVKERLWLLIHDELDLIEDDSKAEELLEHALGLLRKPLPWTDGMPLNGGGGIVKMFTKL